MAVPGPRLVLALAFLVGLFMAGVWVASQGVRQDYAVPSRGDTERAGLDLTDEHVVWLEAVPRGVAVVAYDIAARQRLTLEPANASLKHPVAADGDLAAWTERVPTGGGAWRYRVVVHDLARGARVWETPLHDNVTLPGRTLEGEALVTRGCLSAGCEEGGDGTFVGATRLGAGAGGIVALPAPTDRPLLLARGRLWWADGDTLRSIDTLARQEPLAVHASGPIAGFDADGDVVAWAEARGGLRRVAFAALGNGTRGEASAFEGDQQSPAVNGSRIAFVQRDGLVRLVDVASGEERVLPARTQDNVDVRLAPHWAAWLSRTIGGRNVMLVPLGA